MSQDHAAPATGDTSIESLFEVTMRGYNKRQVEDYVAWLQNEVRSAQDEARNAQTAHQDAQRDLAKLRDDLTAAKAETPAARPAHEEVSERLAQILRLADEEADQKRARAAEDAESTLESAREQSAKVLEAAKSAAEGIISAARERAEKEAAAAKADSEEMLRNATSSSQATLRDAEERAAAVLADADRRTASITALQDERLSSLRDVHTDTLRRLEAVRGVLEKVLTAEADAGPPDNGIAPAPLPVAGAAMRAADVQVSTPAGAGLATAPAENGLLSEGVPTADDYAAGEPEGEPLLSEEYVDGILGDEAGAEDDAETTTLETQADAESGVTAR